MSKKFGERLGVYSSEVPIQIDSIDEDLRTDIWNIIYIYLLESYVNDGTYSGNLRRIHKNTWINFFKEKLDKFPYAGSVYKSYVNAFIDDAEWYRIYEFLEFILEIIPENEHSMFKIDKFKVYINSRLEINNSGFTLINDSFVPITNKNEKTEIETAYENSNMYKLEGIKTHLTSAILSISKKPSPDYRNSIKESISMVETIARIIEPSENTLGKALNKLDKKQKINNNLKVGFEKLYAYTNGKNGIRHAIMNEEKINLEDARYFLISCSAFTNYLIEKAKQENLI